MATADNTCHTSIQRNTTGPQVIGVRSAAGESICWEADENSRLMRF